MRKTLLFLTLMMLSAFGLYAQCVTDIRTTTTNWNDPLSHNTWNWTTDYYSNVYIKNRSYTTVASPFYNPNATFQNPNLIFLQSPAIKDCQPEDGWELLTKDFGNNSNLPASAVTNPFFGLYNRYVGTIRVFFLVVDPLSGTNNGATMSLMFEGGAGRNETALLAPANPVLGSLSNFQKGMIPRMANKYSNEYDYWLFADFPVSYDPCTCLFSSQLTFTVQLIQSTDANLNIKLEGTSTGTVKQVIQASPGGVQANSTSNSVLNWINGLVNSGNEEYNSIQKFIDGGKYLADAFMGLNGTNKTEAYAELDGFNSFLSFIPAFGKVVGIFDYLTGGGRKSATSAGPMAFDVSLKHQISGSADGKLNLSTVRGFRTMYTPGSSVVSTSGIPDYDNVLGIFALLETPKIEYVEYNWEATRPTEYSPSVTFPNPNYNPNCQETPDDPYACYGNYPDASSQVGVLDYRILQYKLTNANLKYAINPAAKLNLVDLQAALVIYDTALNTGPLRNTPATFNEVPAYTDANDRYYKMGYEYETDQKYRTAFVPLSCITNTSIGICLEKSVAYNVRYPVAVYLKIKAILRRQDATATTQDVIYVGTYKADIQRSPSDPGNLKFRLIGTGRIGPDGYSLQPFDYPNSYYYASDNIFYPLPIAGIAGVTNPVFPAGCAGPIFPAQTPTEINTFCNDATKYNHVATSRPAPEDVRPPAGQSTLQNLLSLRNAPNPFSNETTIQFDIPADSYVKMNVLDNAGRLVKQIYAGAYLKKGSYSMKFNGDKIASGVYYLTLVTEYGKVTSKMSIVK